MTSKHGNLPVVDVDQVFPLLTTDATTRAGGQATGTGGDQGAIVAATLRDVLGWRPRAQDTKAFTAALTAAFQLKEVGGHVETTYVQRGFAMQADLGAVTGGQASLYSRAQSAYQQITGLLDGLTPLRTDSDPEDCAAFRLLVRHEITRLVDELGRPGGPRQPIVDSAFHVMVGGLPEGRTVMAALTADDVPGQVGALRERLGLIDANVNTVEEERVRTSFWTLVDLILDLRRSWEEQKVALAGSGSGFLGTDLVLISRLLAAAAEQVDELEAVLDSALVFKAERETMKLTSGSGLTLDGLLSWLRTFLTEDGPMYVRDSGRDGIRTAFAPTAEKLLRAVRHDLIVPVGDMDLDYRRGRGAGKWRSPVQLLPASFDAKLPPGMYAARTRVAVAGLGRLLRDLFTAAARISRYPGVVLFDVQFDRIEGVKSDGNAYMRVAVRGANLRSTYLPVFIDSGDGSEGGRLLPLPGSTSTDDDTLVGTFRFSDQDVDWLLTIADAGSVVLPAQLVPLAIDDVETGAEITAPPTRVWPTLAGVTTRVGLDPVDWSDVPQGTPHAGRFASSSPTEPIASAGAGRAAATFADEMAPPPAGDVATDAVPPQRRFGDRTVTAEVAGTATEQADGAASAAEWTYREAERALEAATLMREYTLQDEEKAAGSVERARGEAGRSRAQHVLDEKRRLAQAAADIAQAAEQVRNAASSAQVASSAASHAIRTAADIAATETGQTMTSSAVPAFTATHDET